MCMKKEKKKQPKSEQHVKMPLNNSLQVINNNKLTTPVSSIHSLVTTNPYANSPLKRVHSSYKRNHILQRTFTAERLKSLREENEHLQQNCDIERKRLLHEQMKFQFLENFIQKWQLQEEQLSQPLKSSNGTQ